MRRRRREPAVIAADIDRIRSLRLDALRRQWRLVFGRVPPAGLSKDLLGRMIAARLQERAFGGLDRDSLRFLESLARHARLPRPQLRPGIVLVREYQGRRHTVTTVRDGFEWQGTTYSSLSAIARAITGTSWSGPRFFAIQRAGAGSKRKGKSAAVPKDGRRQRRGVLDDIHHAYEGTLGVRRLRDRAEVKIFTESFGEPSVLRGFDALVANRERTRFSRGLLETLPDLRIIAQTGNHVYHIDLDATEERGIIVAKATGGGCTSAAELAIGLMIALMRQIPSVDREVKCGGWPTPMTRILRGKTLGIVGLGYVGRHVTKIARAFEMNVLAWGPRLTPQVAASVGADCCEIDTLLSRSDIVSVHATLSPESRGLIDARRLALMRPTAYLINTARGPIVEEVALCNALASKRIAGAGLDVFDAEPLPSGHPLTKFPNVVLTSHLGWPTDEMYSKFADAAADALLAYLEGRDVPRFVAHH